MNRLFWADVAQRKHFAKEARVFDIGATCASIEAAWAWVEAVNNEVRDDVEAVGDVGGRGHDVSADNCRAAVKLFSWSEWNAGERADVRYFDEWWQQGKA